ncbi:MAG TPA: hypothetical protein VNM90_25000, partial [Haliangium sp.]|nr:hypothetical protein [Haliangium sp.]
MKQRARTHSPSPIPAARATRREHWTRTAGLADPEAARPQAYDHARLLALPVGSGAIPIQQSRGVRPSAALARARRDQVEPLPTLPAGREPLARVAAAPPAGRQAERTRAPAPDDTDTAGKQAKRGAGADATRKEGDGELEARVTRLQARVEAQISRLQAVRTLRFRSARWSRLQQNAAAILERLPDLPFDVPGLSSAIGSISAATGVTMYGGFAIVSAAPLIALFELVIA